MHIRYIKPPDGVRHALDREDVRRLGEVLPADIIRRIKLIQVYYNGRSKRQGQVSFIGSRIIVRINFSPKDGRSSLKHLPAKDLRFIEQLGATLNRDSCHVVWRGESARRYALFILLHELSHALFKDVFPLAAENQHGSCFEESWCDAKAMELLHTLLQP